MKIDQLFRVSRSTTDLIQKSYNTGKGKLNGLIIRFKGIQPSSDDRITILNRTKDALYAHANNISLVDLACISDIENGLSAYGGVANLFSLFRAKFGDKFAAAASGGTTTEKIFPFTDELDWAGQVGDLNRAIYVDLGHLTLDQQNQLEINITLSALASAPAGNEVIVSSVYASPSADIFYQYDTSRDFENTVHQVRSIYLTNKGGLFDENHWVREMAIQLETDKTRLMQLGDLYAATQLFGKIEGAANRFAARLYQESLPLPTSALIKVTGDIDANDKLIYKRETVPANASNSTVDNLKEITRQIEKLEKSNTELAKRYRHIGVTQKSEELEVVTNRLEASNRADERGA
jgi:hypothetical protein